MLFPLLSISLTFSLSLFLPSHIPCSQDSCGKHPCYVNIDTKSKHAFVANYTGGSISVLPLGPDGAIAPASDSKHHDGLLIPTLADRQESTHPHAINLDPYVGKVIHSRPLSIYLHWPIASLPPTLFGQHLYEFDI